MKRNLVLNVSLLSLLALLLYPSWLPWIGTFLIVADPLQEAEALALLAGDENERIAAGALLFRQGYASWFILTDIRLKIPDSQGIYSATVKRKAVEQGVPEEYILIVPGQVSTTYEEALRLKEFTVSGGFRSLIVVTSPYHTRRARWILRQVFQESDVALSVQPAINHPYQAQTWWITPEDRWETFVEYGKLIAHLAGCRAFDDCGLVPREWLEAVRVMEIEY